MAWTFDVTKQHAQGASCNAGSNSQSRSTSGDGSGSLTSSSYSSRNVSARSAGQPPVAPGTHLPEYNPAASLIQTL